MSYEQFNFSNEMQDCILACMIRYPDEFWTYSYILRPQYFNGVDAAEVAFALKDYVEEFGKYPNFSTLMNWVYQKFERSNVDKANQLVDYVIKLTELDTADWEGIRKLMIKFAKERALFAALRKIHAAQMEGKGNEVDPLVEILDAMAVGSSGFITASDLLARNIPAQVDVVKGLLRQGDVMLAGGGSKDRKTWMAMDLVVCVANGLPWLGMETTPCSVLYAGFELSDYDMQHRLRVIAQHHKLDGAALSTIECKNYKGLSLAPSDVLAELASRCLRQKHKLCIIDPLYSLLAGKLKESAAEDIKKIMDSLAALARAANTAVYLPAHFTKGSPSEKEHIDLISGSGVFARATDVLATTRPHREPGAYTYEVTLRGQPELPKMAIRWKYPVFEPAPELDPDDLKEPNRKKNKAEGREERDAAAMLKVLIELDGPVTVPDWMEACKQSGDKTLLKLSRSTFYRRLEKLEDHGRIVSTEDDLWEPKAD